jgi:hypothetical protein
MPARRLAVFCEPARAERANIAATTQTAGAERASITATTETARAEAPTSRPLPRPRGSPSPSKRWGQGVAYVRDPFGTLVEPASPTD